MHVYHQYTVRVPEDRDGFAAALEREHGIGTGVYYPVPSTGWRRSAPTSTCPETERAAARVLSLPVHPSVTAADLERIVKAVNAVAAAGG